MSEPAERHVWIVSEARIRRTVRRSLVCAAVLSCTACAPSGGGTDRSGDEWPFYGHDAGGGRFSPLTQIDRSNVARLAPAWTFHTGDMLDRGNNQRTGFETTPIVVDGTMYLTTGVNRIIALDPETGKQRWSFDPKIDPSWGFGDGLINRGVSTWLDATKRSADRCRRRIFEATLDARLVAIDAASGAPCVDFGTSGEVSLTGVNAYRRGAYHMTSPPAVIDDLVIVGSAIDDNGAADMPAGVVRAFDARTGQLRWHWDPIPRELHSGAANAWSVMVVDPYRHLVFVPTGSASPDYFGGARPGDNKWANSVVALHAATGAVAWGFQLVHHDLWDYDSAAPPLLATVVHQGRRVPAVVQGNKTGFLYVLNRATGEPIFPVSERPVPKSDIDGETAWPTQPFPSAPPAVSRQRLPADDVWGATSEQRESCRSAIARLRNEGLFTPPSAGGTLVLPGNLGGMNWSGYAFDEPRGLLVVNTNDLPAAARLIPREHFAGEAERNADRAEYAPQAGTPYGMARRFIRAASGLPCNAPPWGHLTAVDLGAGTIRWQVPLGTLEGFGGAHGVPPGGISVGGPIITAGGLVFIAGTLDSRIRAFDIETGRELWSRELPAPGNATPMTFRVSAAGRQYVVIAAGGHAKVSETPIGDTLIAFALPQGR